MDALEKSTRAHRQQTQPVKEKIYVPSLQVDERPIFSHLNPKTEARSTSSANSYQPYYRFTQIGGLDLKFMHQIWLFRITHAKILTNMRQLVSKISPKQSVEFAIMLDYSKMDCLASIALTVTNISRVLFNFTFENYHHTGESRSLHYCLDDDNEFSEQQYQRSDRALGYKVNFNLFDRVKLELEEGFILTAQLTDVLTEITQLTLKLRLIAASLHESLVILWPRDIKKQDDHVIWPRLQIRHGLLICNAIFFTELLS